MPTIRETGPAQAYYAVTPHDSTNFTAGPCRGLYVGTTGNLVAVKMDGSTVTFSTIPAGMILPIVAVRVNSTSTTASNIVALY